jgi:predicted ATPase
LFLISGEPGIGKTRLADEIAIHSTSRGVKVLWGRCWEGGGAPAYWPWIQLIRVCLANLGPEQAIAMLGSEGAPNVAQDIAQIVPDLRQSFPTIRSSAAPALDPEQARFRLFDSVAILLRNSSAAHPLMLVFDDLHEADQPSLQMLTFVTRELKSATVLVVAIYRDVEVRQSPDLSKLIGELSREGTHIPLGGLAEGDVGRMFETRARLPIAAATAADLCRATAGNPLFVDGVVRVLVAEGKLKSGQRLDFARFKVPEGVRETIRRRLHLLSERGPLRVAAAIGDEFELSLLARVTELGADKLLDLMEQAASVGILTAGDSRRYRFGHALIREALYEEVPASERSKLHHKIGEGVGGTSER